MSFLSRLFQSTRPAAKRRAAQKRSAGLGLECLEERWTPAVSILGQGTDAVTITDTAATSVNNSIEIIDDLSTLTTYIRVNNGAEQQLGQAGNLLSSLDISMGVGKDKVTFSTRGFGNSYDGNLTRNVDLGSGNDSLVIKLSDVGNFNNYTLDYNVTGDTSGNDSYSVAGSVINGGFAFDLSCTSESSGNDKYSFALSGTDAGVDVQVRDDGGNDSYVADLFSHDNDLDVFVELYDYAGNDSYSLTAAGVNVTCDGAVGAYVADRDGSDSYTINALASSGVEDLYFTVEDGGAGKNKATFTQGDMVDVQQNVRLDFGGKSGASVLDAEPTSPSSAAVTIRGDALISGDSDLSLYFYGGRANDSFSFDDNVLTGPEVSQTVTFDAGLGNDKVSILLDGRPRSGKSAIDAGADLTIQGTTGVGDDSIAARLRGASWSASDASVGGTGFNLDIDGEDGNDRFSCDTGNKPLSLFNGNAYAIINFDGGAGNDSFSVDVGYIGGANLAGTTPNGLDVVITAGTGADRIEFGGYLKLDDPTLVLDVFVDLGSDTDRDVLKSRFRPSVYITLPVQATYDFQYDHYVAANDVLDLLAGPGVPVWTAVTP